MLACEVTVSVCQIMRYGAMPLPDRRALKLLSSPGMSSGPLRSRLPVTRVLASPYCRTLETGRLIFGHAETSLAARGGPPDDSGDRYAELRALLSTPVTRGTNLAIASHGNPYRAVVGGAYLAEGEAAIIAPRGKDGFRVVARVTKDEWKALAP